jgi:hypothetical protein
MKRSCCKTADFSKGSAAFNSDGEVQGLVDKVERVVEKFVLR